MLFVTYFVTTSCIHTQNIEDRCAKQGLRIETLTIEEKGEFNHSKVRCYDSLEDNEG